MKSARFFRCGVPPAVLAAVISLGAPAPALAAHPQSELDQITARGRTLYEYDAAAARATDAVKPVAGTPTGLSLYVGHRSGNFWVFDFGRLVGTTGFMTSFEASQSADGSFVVVRFPKPRRETGFNLAAARAAQLAGAEFGAVTRPYNFAILPAPNAQLYVYVYPAQTDPQIHPLGGDVRYTVSADGSVIVETHPMHKRILEIAPTVPAGSQLNAGFNADIFSDIPEDTDVFHVLIRRPALPEYVLAGGELYKIAINGTITDTGLAHQP